MGRLDRKVALITGGARGMGKSHARHFTAQGARVVIGDILDEKGTELAAELGDSCRYVHQDVTSEQDWAAAVAAATDAFGSLNVLVNNAGILRNEPIAEMTLASFREVIEVNLIGEWLGVKNVIEPMTRPAAARSSTSRRSRDSPERPGCPPTVPASSVSAA